MVTFNFFPWRVRQKDYEKKTVKRMVVLAVLAALGWNMGVHVLLSMRYEAVHSKAVQMQAKQQQLMQARERQEIRLQAAAQVAAQQREVMTFRQETGALLLALNQANSAPICFSEIVRQGQQMQFSGYVRSAADFSTYLLHWPAARYFASIKVEKLQINADDHFWRFRLRALTNSASTLHHSTQKTREESVDGDGL